MTSVSILEIVVRLFVLRTDHNVLEGGVGMGKGWAVSKKDAEINQASAFYYPDPVFLC